MRSEKTVLIKGAGEVASGVAHYLFSKGFEVIMTELPKPTVQRRTVSFAEAVFSGEIEVQGIKGKRAENYSEVLDILKQNMIPILIDPESEVVEREGPEIIIDARMAKENLGTTKEEAKLVIGLGPGFEAGKDVDIVIETVDDSNCGKIIESGFSEPNTGVPCNIQGYSSQRVLRAPVEGVFKACKSILDSVEEKEKIGEVDGEEIRAKISGKIRGLLKDGLKVQEGQKIGDIDPRDMEEFGIAERSLEIAEGVWRAIKDYELEGE